jgi:outer membrane protein insertion porin family
LKYLGCIQVLVGSVLILILGMVLTLPVMAEANPTVLMFDVQGNTHVATEKILGAISNIRMGESLDSKAIQLDMQAIMALGYFADVRVNTEKIFDGVKLIFEVVENPLFKEVRISGLTKMKSDELKPFFSQKPGDVFNTVLFKDDLSKAIKFCQEKKGLFVEPKLKDAGTAISSEGVVQVELAELRYGKIKITGLVKTKDYVVRRELSAKEGEIIDYALLKEDYMKIMRLRLFDNVDIRFENSSTPGAMDLILEAKEAQTGTLSLGISYSETSQEMGGLLSYSEANLMGLGQNISLDLNIAESSRNVQFNFYEPWLDDKHSSFGLSMWNSESDITSTMHSWEPSLGDNHYNLALARTGLSLSFGRPLWSDITGRIKFNFEKNEISNYYATDDTAKAHPLNSFPYQFWDNSVEVELVKNRLSYQDRNFVNGGYQLLANYSVSGPYLGGNFDYQKALLEGKWFQSLSPNLVLGTRLQGGLLFGNYPDYDALYLGGMYKLRGYDDRRFSDSNTTNIIGDSYLLSNTDLRYRLPSNKDLEFVLFYDVGEMNNSSGDRVIKSDYGIGFRYNIPFLGVLRIDQAWNRDQDAKLVFSLGEMF